MTDRLERNMRRGRAYLDDGQPQSAQVVLEAVIAEQPQNAEALYQLSVAMARQKYYREAIGLAARAVAIDGDKAEYHAHLASCSIMIGDTVQALAAVERGAALKPQSAEVCNTLGSVYSYVGKEARALQFYELASVRDPQRISYRYNRANSLGSFGDLDAAEVEYEMCIRLDPNHAKSHLSLAQLRKQRPESNHVERLQQTLGRCRPGSRSETMLCFALFKELDDLGRWDEAFAALDRGCSSRRQQISYSLEHDRMLCQRMIALCDQHFLTQPTPQPKGPRPIFIVGMPRTGTTLLERILGGHSQIAEAGELQDFPAQIKFATGCASQRLLELEVLDKAASVNFSELGKHYIESVERHAQGRSLFTDKLPFNFWFIGFIHRALPHARIINLVRDPADTCFSNLKLLFTNLFPCANSQVEIAEYYLLYRRLMTHWHQMLPGKILDVSYEQLVNDPEGEARRLLKYCELPWESECLQIEKNQNPVTTASSIQVRQPIYRSSVQQWRRYEKFLGPMLQVLKGL